MEGEEELLEDVTNVTIGSDETGSSYMIQHNGQLLSSDLLQHSNGLVVDLGGDYIPVNYSSEDLLSQDLTEEDRNLAAALVAVQFSQQQKQQQTQQDGSVIINTALPSLSNVLNGSKVTLTDQQVLLQDKQTGYLQIVDAGNLYKQAEFDYDEMGTGTIQLIKNEEHETLEQPSDVDTKDHITTTVATTSARKSLPHKKRLSKKLKNKVQIKRVHKCSMCDLLVPLEEADAHQQLCQANVTAVSTMSATFSCQLCSSAFADQLQFFEHLKTHYEPATLKIIEHNQLTETMDHAGSLLQEETHQQMVEPITLPSNDQNIEHIQLDESSIIKMKQSPNQKDSLLSSILQLPCLQCNKTFRRQKAYEAHIRDCHTKDEINEFSEPEDLMAGITVNPSSDIEDEDKTWYRDDELHATEEDLRELEAQEHVCQYCQQPFSMRSILDQHLLTCSAARTTTTKAEPAKEETKKKRTKKVADLECTECDRKFSHRNSLVYHMRSHTGDRPHQCDQCGKSFFAASALKVHLRLHSGDKPYRCEFCGRHFRQWGDLKYHCISIHSNEKQYQCEYCGKDFARKYSLIVHRRIHTGEKNYRCEFCGKTFRASSYLQNHRRIHTGEKPHPCELCGKRFRVRSDMKRHLRTHTRRRIGGRPAHTVGNEELMKLEDTQESEDTNESMALLKEGENEAAVQSLQYDQDTLEAVVRDGNALYVMPILIS